jgi:hypothetical protein
MNRRELLKTTGVGILAGSLANWTKLNTPVLGTFAASPLRWSRFQDSSLFEQVYCEERPLVPPGTFGLLESQCHLLTDKKRKESITLRGSKTTSQLGPVHLTMVHRLHNSQLGYGNDLLQAIVTLRNTSDQLQSIEIGFVTSAQPSKRISDQHVYLPISAAGLTGDSRLAPLGSRQFLKDCRQLVGMKNFECHYLEPMASYHQQRQTRALLLAPVVDIYHPGCQWRVAVFTSSDQSMRFATLGPEGKKQSWLISRCVTVPAGRTLEQSCFLLLHQGDASAAWKAFHRFAHHEDFAPVDWIRQFRVHYYDFLSSVDGKNGHRGSGYEADLAHFRAFHVGMATQHGYYPTLGEYIHPDRKTWKAMRGDKKGPVEMSLEKIRNRIRSTRKAGAHAAVYIHPVLFDDAASFFNKFRDSVLVDDQARPVQFPWKGPDTVGQNWRASIASEQWRKHLLQQTQWIMELLKPDAIVVDETFAGIGYDYHPDHAGPMASHAIDLYRKMREIVKSFGSERALFTSDCSMTGFCMWADGESGDHAYPGSLGNPLYRQEPVRYLAALGDKPWRPCAWHFRGMWNLQMQLAHQVGAGVGVSNGWIEFTGLNNLPSQQRKRLIADIEQIMKEK